jgi:hypothetical protein
LFDPSPPPPPESTVESPQATDESTGDYLRLILHVNRTTGEFTSVSQSRSSDPPPQSRTSEPEPDEWLVQAQTAEGEVVWERPIWNPTVTYHEDVDPTSGAMSGERVVSEDADFPLVIPDDATTDHLSFYEPTPSGLDLIGTYDLEGAS